MRRSLGVRFISSVGVVGAGQMGTGIAYVSAVSSKLPTIMIDSNQDQLDKSKAFIEKLLQKAISRDKMIESDAQSVRDRLQFNTQIEALEGVDIAIEAATENLDVKTKIFTELDRVMKNPKSILATNTSSISITKLASSVSRPEFVIGMHFMNPVPIMKLIEMISGLQTSSDTLQRTLELAKSMNKTTTISSDAPGFIVNRLLMPYINEAIFALQEGVGTIQDIDTSMKLGTNVPMGPLQLADFIGLDTCLAIMNVLHEGMGDSKYRPANLLVKYVDAGWLGKKSGRGFYNYQ